MNIQLAERLLTKTIGWSSDKINKNINELLYMSKVKYDDYDGYMPGTRFLGSLSTWLECFEADDRTKLLEFLKKNLTFISSTQMFYLISLLYSSKVKPALMKQVCDKLTMPSYQISRITDSDEFRSAKRKSLFVGLSDGAHMDIIRREFHLSNEQVLTMYYPSKNKLKEMQSELEKDLKEESTPKFESIFLIDDFTASGRSFIKNKDGEYKGKLSKIFKSIFPKKGDEYYENSLQSICSENVKVYIYFSIATEEALQYIKDELSKFFVERGIDPQCLVDMDKVQVVKSVDFTLPENQAVQRIIEQEKYLNRDNVVTEPFKNGSVDEPWKGFNGCGLAIVLSHNTPNNSLSVLWQDAEPNYPSLFPRISRH